MGNYKTTAYVNSLNIGKTRPENTGEITVLEKVGDNDYIVDYNGVKCHALYNFFVGAFFADDIYGRVTE